MSLQYPLVELLTGCIFVGMFLVAPPALTLPGIVLFLSYLGFWSALIALVVYDVRHTLIPLPFIYGLIGFAVVGVGARTALVLTAAPALDALVGAFVCGGFFALINVLTRGKGMGIGDAYVACGIGLMLGLESGIVASVLAVWIGAVVGLMLLGLTHMFPRARLTVGGKRVTLKAEIPFAPFLALGAIVAFMAHIAPFVLGFWGVPY
jgi:leader peptidase (prepilin peptidase)/N-methyltransferase